MQANANPKPSGPKWQRLLIAGFAVGFLLAGLLVTTTDILQVGSKEFVAGTLLKVGFVLALAWIAAPQLERFGWDRLRGTLLVGVIIVIVLWSIRPRIGAIAGAVLAGSTLLFTAIGWIRSLTQSQNSRRRP